MPPYRRPLAGLGRVLLLLVVLLAACGPQPTATPGAAPSSAASTSSTPPAPSRNSSAAPTAPEENQTEAVPERIVSLSPTATEMLFAIGAGDQVLAVDSQSNYPPEAPITDLSAFQPSVEAIAALEPDLVVLSYDPGGIVAGLEAVGIATLLQDAAVDLEGTFSQLRELGELTGNTAGAEQVISDLQAEIDALVADVPPRDPPLTYYHELDATLYTVTSDSFVGEIYRLAGLENIADPADADGQAAGYPQLTPEFIIGADPDLVFLADATCCDVTPESFAARPGFQQLTAVQRGNVIPVDESVASRWGPRLVELLRVAVDAAAAVDAP